MFEDKLPILIEVFNIYNLIQRAKQKGIKIVHNEEISNESKEEESISEFSNLISQSNQHIKSIEKNINKIIPLKSQILDATDEQEKNISKSIDDIIKDVHTSQVQMKAIIDELKLKINENQKEKTEIRLKKNLFDAMLKKYQSTIQRFQNEESEIKKIRETKLIRGVEINLKEDLNEDQKREVIDNPQMLQQILENKLKGEAHVKLKNAVRDLEERRRDIIKLEKSIMELHEMVIELSGLVQYQGEVIDNIFENISKAKEYTLKGEKEIEEGKKNLQCSKKMKCIILLIAIAALIIILIPTLVTVLKK